MHNTLLHRDDGLNHAAHDTTAPRTSALLAPTSAAQLTQPVLKSTDDVVKNMSAINKQSGRVLLATALINIFDIHGRPHEVRAILDSGSQASFMTESLLKTLGLNHKDTMSTVAGINDLVSVVNKRCDAIIQSRVNSFKTNITFLVLPNITSTKNEVFNVGTLNIPSGIQLADPEYFSPSSYDILLGADIFWDLLCANKIRLGKNCPVLQETKFGYIISGPTGQQTSNKISCNFSKFDEIQDQLAKFWTIEEVPSTKKSIYTDEEELCEAHFVQNMSRNEDGRFSVGIPLKGNESELGQSFERAKACFLALERRLAKQPVLRAMYVDFMKEYLSLGHMALSDIDAPHENSYFMPHHGVLRDESTTTKLRVVFNASAPTNSGLSLNDLQMVGPTIQSDLFSILLRFRQHRYVMAGDIEKMYRQVLVNENQRHLQQIIWRDDPSQPLQTYTLNTVTYGTASAPFLSVRCLKQIADECDNELVRKVISEDFYVDDLLTGHETAEGLMEVRALISQELSSGCFNLRKFRSNLPVCSDGSDPNRDSPVVDLSEHQQSKTLGLKWAPSDDVFQFDIKTETVPNTTKRAILSTISQIFDPLGLLSIFIIAGKIILQKLWLHKLDWDSPLPSDIVKSWLKFVTDLKQLDNLNIPRHVVCQSPVNIQFHAFCDSSKDAYGACVYVRSVDFNGTTQVRLLCSKTRVAPIKTVTIPRLELCGALVAAKLLEKVLKTTRLHIDSCFLWTDSSVVLGWLKTPPNKLKPFVKNRVADIQEITNSYLWRHVPTSSNPADLLSRGIGVLQSDKVDLWFNGPKFLLDPEESWPDRSFDQSSTELPEVRSNVALTANEPRELFPFSRFSSLTKLKNTMAYVLRFVTVCRSKNKTQSPLSSSEQQSALNTLVKLSQRESFDVYEYLIQGKSLPPKHKMLSLSPFVDEKGLIRVGGRIKNGNFTFDKKHPLMLTSKHILTKLIFQYEHLRLMHAGPQLLLASIREEFWPIGGRNLARFTVHKCLRCFRLNAQIARPIMGNLPEQRLQPGYPFYTTGMDYAGPLIALNKRGRGSKTEKVYIAIFICFATKCVHLELVSSLSTDSFLATLNRFIGRRSRPATIFSDNGTQFVGARNELYKFLNQNASSIVREMSNDRIDFKFIPAYAAHMAGFWEANIKCLKSHLHRVLGNAHLVFEDLYTVLVQIEAILNSRPLTPLSTDPTDLTPLTPGHFLVGRPMTALPTPALVNVNTNRLTQYERLEQLRQHFWARWHKEYIAELQQRTKWRTSKGQQLQKGALVLIKEEGLPPMKWRLGRIVEVYPGTDGCVRVADVKTARGVIRRGFNRICPLPVNDEGLKDKPFNAGGHVKNSTEPSPTAPATAGSLEN
ncbi:uncharacterized protein LOC123655084 [Melitaea cinxia]|uniref:uncharacterized protein LOC123655084 n=1 Tax=Melitaea cinxia TaxID=113334 RepID=UPI001E2731E4|nr:uncharacterized protein LOC123655084 [Melitaea cinxia]